MLTVFHFAGMLEAKIQVEPLRAAVAFQMARIECFRNRKCTDEFDDLMQGLFAIASALMIGVDHESPEKVLGFVAIDRQHHEPRANAY